MLHMFMVCSFINLIIKSNFVLTRIKGEREDGEILSLRKK